MMPGYLALHMSELADALNPAQLQAVHHLRGSCLVLAGAGSGKTRVIVHKIAQLLRTHTPAQRVAAITFTNKAAAEMRSRTQALVGPRAAGELTVCTFHALGVRILRSHGTTLGLKPNFSIFDSDDALGILREAGGTTDASQARRWQWAISLWKNQGLNAEQALQQAGDESQRHIALVMRKYEERLAAYQAVDFDDLIALPLKLLRTDTAAREVWQDTFDHILIDEVQDTNAVQYELLKALLSPRACFTAVGDDDQSIYGWRGATLDNLRRLGEDFPDLKVIALEQNYRSTGAILRAANHVIAANPKLFAKTLWSAWAEGEPVHVLACDSPEHEAEKAVARIQALRAQGGQVRLSDFAILYRANHQSRAFEQKLRAAQLPYRVSGGQSFFDRMEIKDLCAWLRLWINSDDDPAFLRAVTTPRRGIGHHSLTALGEFAARFKISLFEAVFSPSVSAVLKDRALHGLEDFAREVTTWSHRAQQAVGSDAAREVMQQWLRELGYEQHLHDSQDREVLAAARWSHVMDFVEWMCRRCGGQPSTAAGDMATPARSLLEVAQTVNVLLSVAEREDTSDVITLSTLHAAKGLEWHHVLLAGVNEGLLPFHAQDEPLTPAALQEERRLMYVGVTRARTTLAVSTLKRRQRGRELVTARPSRFIDEMKLHETVVKEDPRERLRRLRQELAQQHSQPLTSP